MLVQKEARRLTNMAEHLSYETSGVDTVAAEVGLKSLLKWVGKTLGFAGDVGQVQLQVKYFANVISIGHNIGVAICTDGVGTKALVAQAMNKYDTVGIDCVAMNVNDCICVGADPITMVDYLAIEEPRRDLLEEIGKGLYEGARLAGITISGGEIAHLREMIKGEREGYAFDLAGTCVGLVPLDRIIVGQDIKEKDVVVGFRSNGIHSNGLTLARRVVHDNHKLSFDKHLPELGRSIGAELLEPTRIYVPEARELWRSGLEVKALVHITSDGFLNLTRVSSDTGYVIEYLPDPHPIFEIIQRYGNVTDEEMFRVYNMGIGFCVVVPEEQVAQVISIAHSYGTQAYRLGYTVTDKEKKVTIEPKRLVSVGNKFVKYRSAH